MTSIGGNLWINQHSSLTSLSGLDNIDAESIEGLQISDNPYLSHCSVLSICNYLSNPNGTIDITNNTTGCDSPEQVQDSCEANSVNIDEQYIKDNLELYPNPASQELNIFTDDGREIGEVIIYTLTGQQIVKARSVNGKVDISHLQSGMYIVEVMIENRSFRQKLLVE